MIDLSLDPAGTRTALAAAILLGYTAFCGLVYGHHRRARVRLAALAGPPLESGTEGGAQTVLVAYASQTGFAERLALRTAGALRGSGTPVCVAPLGALTAEALAGCSRALFIVSTTGEGDPPDGAARFARRVMGGTADLRGLRYAVLALGDRDYARYCAFGRALDAWLHHQGATALFDRVEVDDGDDGALRHWQHNLTFAGGRADMADWSTPDYGRWRLAARRHLNPGSPGAPVFHVVLTPLDGPQAWKAGDIAEIGPRDPADPRRKLPHREYSIASTPEDGGIELLVRQVRGPDGRLGIGSGWLTEHAAVGAEIALRVRENRGFHGPADDRPLILIGNGTGIAGLRAHLRERARAGHRRNWLLFGERSPRHDRPFAAEIARWHADSVLERLDLAFSRDPADPAYVQDRLAAAGPEVARWVAEGAAIYVCGSLQGMASGVAEALTAILGEAMLETMAAEGRYRRDVY
ncbi:sulfite reductase flavoprotein subunit alpha [Azospirillum sp. RWY-5-1]|uniref:NADPH--hemoprotein reductase n=1 Tax=Azospirillum oleiclasticum TaxID=2735135 RepID=A0ABX2THU4_9PROT|nr:sulfite reductase subunit alpha [Azospirillum oleiclasticum]NYZ16378.1 sulfite reductase flavoprotein subunit alpha [Azospirillum oleiclasticum]NYZ23906.1 sulfite reductase flavoprotein subunit alpha [Azospirillum oleiclasticum]